MASRQIHIADVKQRDAEVNFQGFTKKTKVIFVDANNESVKSKKFAKFTTKHSYDSLKEKYPDKNTLANAIIEEDPDVDLDMAGRFLGVSSRIYINSDNKIVFKINTTEIVYDTTGVEKERREPKSLISNILTEQPLIWSGRMFPIKDVYKKFIFTRKYQLQHTNGLTYDMLFQMAKDLHEAKSLMLIGSGNKGVGPVIFQDGGNAFRVFLEGRIENDQYILLMHLSNLELKAIN